jgi:hypothetical protein
MSNEPVQIIHRADLPVGGFAGIVETQMVMNPTYWDKSEASSAISHGLNDFVYLSIGYFKPHDGATLHPHDNIDIVSVVLNSDVGHKGTLGDGSVIHGLGVQVQRAGTGMQHSEFNLNDTNADFIQLWFKPPENDLIPDYQNIKLVESGMTTVLGGQNDGTFHSNMICQVGYLETNESITTDKPFITLITSGSVMANGVLARAGDLVSGNKLKLHVEAKAGLILIQDNQN